MAKPKSSGLPRITVTYQKGKGFKKMIGWCVGKSGERQPKIWWLGHDERQATLLASMITALYGTMRDEGVLIDCWNEDSLVVVKGAIDAQRESWQAGLDEARALLAAAGAATTASGGTTAARTTDRSLLGDVAAGKTLYGAIAAYSEHLKGKRKSDKHKHRATQVVEVNLRRVRQDCPLSEIDFVWIDSLCDHFKSRPKNLKDGTPIKPAGVKNILTYLRLFFVWIDDTEYGGWQAPRKMLKCFKIRLDELMTPTELRERGTIRQFDLATLKRLYAAASDRVRTWMLMALFTGSTQQELAVMEKAEFDLDAAKLEHIRNKTRVRGTYWLPPELVTLLRTEFGRRADDPLAFRTSDGNPLVTFKDGRQTSDAVRQAWDDLRDQAALPDALPFKFLRKFLGDWMTRRGGEELGQIALSHSRQTVLARNYTTSRAFDRFHEMQREMHKELFAADVFNLPIDDGQLKRVDAA